jgi:hypothetical protein
MKVLYVNHTATVSGAEKCGGNRFPPQPPSAE